MGPVEKKMDQEKRWREMIKKFDPHVEFFRKMSVTSNIILSFSHIHTFWFDCRRLVLLSVINIKEINTGT